MNKISLFRVAYKSFLRICVSWIQIWSQKLTNMLDLRDKWTKGTNFSRIYKNVPFLSKLHLQNQVWFTILWPGLPRHTALKLFENCWKSQDMLSFCLILQQPNRQHRDKAVHTSACLLSAENGTRLTRFGASRNERDSSVISRVMKKKGNQVSGPGGTSYGPDATRHNCPHRKRYLSLLWMPQSAIKPAASEF